MTRDIEERLTEAFAAKGELLTDARIGPGPDATGADVLDLSTLRRRRRANLWIGPLLAAAAVVAFAVGITVLPAAHSTSADRHPTATTGTPTDAATDSPSASGEPESSDAASPSASSSGVAVGPSGPSATGATPTHPATHTPAPTTAATVSPTWYKGIDFSKFPAGTACGTRVDRQLVVPGSPAMVVIEGSCNLSVPFYWIGVVGPTDVPGTAWISDFAGKLQSITVNGDGVDWTFIEDRADHSTPNPGGDGTQGLALYSSHLPARNVSAGWSPQVDITPQCTASQISTGQVTLTNSEPPGTYPYAWANGLNFTGPSSPCWFSSAVTINMFDAAGAQIDTRTYDGGRFYPLTWQHGSAFTMTMPIGWPIWPYAGCGSVGATVKPPMASSVDVITSWTTQHLAIPAVYRQCITNSGIFQAGTTN